MMVIDNKVHHRFELTENGLVVFADYRLEGAAFVIPHVEAEPALRGTGAAARLMEGIVVLARAKGFAIEPCCSYARVWFRRHPESADVIRPA
jgi:uncharacterized protein